MLCRTSLKQCIAGQGACTFGELYGYTKPGQLSSRTLQIQSGSYSTSLAENWTGMLVGFAVLFLGLSVVLFDHAIEDA